MLFKNICVYLYSSDYIEFDLQEKGRFENSVHSRQINGVEVCLYKICIL